MGIKKEKKVPQTGSAPQKGKKDAGGLRKLGKALLVGVGVMAIILVLVWGYHAIKTKSEEKYLTPLGQMVEVKGKSMSVYVDGAGDKTLVFLPGAGTCSPILDFKSLDSLLTDSYRVAVVEKFGYGFSDSVDWERDVDTVLDETRSALTAAGVEGPYVLCPHAMSGIHALRWAQKYPGEVEGIIGLDMSLPAVYKTVVVDEGGMKMAQWANNAGLTRLSGGVPDGPAVLYGTLTEEEKSTWRALFYRNAVTTPMINEAKAIEAGSALVAQNGVPEVPMLLFVSTGVGGTGYDTDTWRAFFTDYAAGHDNIQLSYLECGHYVHDLAYEQVAQQIKDYLK